MTPAFLLAIYCGLVVLAAFFGGWLPQKIKLTHVRQQLIVSFVGGLMLGVALLHLLPHSVQATGSVDRTAAGALVGVLVIFALLRAFHSHHHSVADEPGVAPCGHPQHVHQKGTPAIAPAAGGLPILSSATVEPAHDHAGDHDHGHAHGHSHGHGHQHGSHELSWVGLVLGFGVHTIIDGMALGASVYSDAHHLGVPALWGLATFLAVFLHKPLDAASISLVMGTGGWSNRARLIVTAAFSTLCPIGALLFVLGLESVGDSQPAVVGAALSFSAGAFLCIALSDLLPEIEFHGHDRGKLSLLLLAGVAVAWGVGFLEPAHVHGPEGSVNHSSHAHDHDGASHDAHGHDDSAGHAHDHAH